MRPNYRSLSVYLVGVFMGALDTNVLAPVFPLIMRGFHIPLGWAAWTVTSYTVAYIASTVLAGAWGDRIGHKKLFVWGIVAFMLASLLAAFSPNFWVFMLARVVQGAGAGAVYPNAQAEGIREFPAERRGTALGMFGAVFGMASVLGPTLGGLLGQYLGWPAVFWINVPIALVVLTMSRRVAASPVQDRPVPDWKGGASFSVLLAAALLVLMGTGYLRVVFAGVAALALLVFMARQRHASSPFLDDRPLKRGSGVSMMIGAALIGLDMSAAVFVPTLVQRVLHFSVLASGLALLPAAFSGAILSGVGGVMVDRVGPRRLLVVGLVAGAIGGVLLAWPPLTFTRFIIAMLFFGLGTAFTMGAPLNRMALALYRDDQSGEALSLVAVFRGIGLAAGPVILTAADSVRGFSGMYGAVAVASLVGVFAFLFVPDVKPVKQGQAVSES
ncbi:MFS transporter [Sulfobacillus harzensis]|uniref:MFS transporter n=1 Tax=Sulfobacillus harzensis TaxID=2729629 RepID=A0A7Y0Q4G4_9FIRM|nr:MFS transporter [Sulfobacillus harzensis]NMP23224.1 MFS transporter [Sulfobacillus harzensis]